MSLETVQIMGIKTRDPHLPGRLYLTDDGSLNRDLKNARIIHQDEIETAEKILKKYSTDIFSYEVVEPL